MSTGQESASSWTADEIIEAARDLYGLQGSSWEQFRRYAREYLVWCDQHAVELPGADVDRARYRAHLEASGKATRPRHWTLRATAINKLLGPVAELRRRARARASARRTRLIDVLPLGSPERAAVDAILQHASGSYRASLRADLAVFLEWCLSHSRPIGQLELADLHAFEQWLVARRRSKGPIFAAKRLHRRVQKPEAWWR
jgi:hypothetical protein